MELADLFGLCPIIWKLYNRFHCHKLFLLIVGWGGPRPKTWPQLVKLNHGQAVRKAVIVSVALEVQFINIKE